MFTTEVRLKAQDSLPIDGPTEVILHSLGNGYNFEGGVGWLEDPSNPLEAHYAIRRDGYRVQVVSYFLRADANYNANRRAISIETDSSVEAYEPWTDAQVASIIELIVELIRKFPTIEAILCPEWDAPGIGYHILFGSPGAWTPAAKVCAGPARNQQVIDTIIPGVQAALAGTPTVPTVPDTPEELFTVGQFEDLLAAINATNKNVDDSERNLVAVVRATGANVRAAVATEIRSNTKTQTTRFNQLRAAVDKAASLDEVRKLVSDAVDEIEHGLGEAQPS